MRLTDYCDALNITLIVRYYPNQDNRWCAYFEDCEIKGPSTLTSAHGNGSLPSLAIRDYIEGLLGKTIVFNAMGGVARREFVFPKAITVNV